MIVVRRRGRLRKGGGRDPSGKIRRMPRAERVDQIVKVAFDARQRVHGLTTSAAAQPRSGDLLGRLSLSGEINRGQYEAGLSYAQMRGDYDRAMLAQRLVEPGEPESRPGYDDRDGSAPGYRAWVEHTIKQHAKVRRALAECHDPLAATVLDGIVLEGRQMWNFIGTLRLALNAIGRVL